MIGDSILRARDDLFDFFCRLGCSGMPNKMVHSDMIIYISIRYLNTININMNLEDYIHYETLEAIEKQEKSIEKYILNFNGSYDEKIEAIAYMIEDTNKKINHNTKNEKWDEFYDKFKEL